MKYFFRLGICLVSSFIVIFAYNVAFKLSSQMSLDFFISIISVAFACSFLSGAASAAIFKKNDVLMVVFSQVFAILFLAVLWRI